MPFYKGFPAAGIVCRRHGRRPGCALARKAPLRRQKRSSPAAKLPRKSTLIRPNRTWSNPNPPTMPPTRGSPVLRDQSAPTCLELPPTAVSERTGLVIAVPLPVERCSSLTSVGSEFFANRYRTSSSRNGKVSSRLVCSGNGRGLAAKPNSVQIQRKSVPIRPNPTP